MKTKMNTYTLQEFQDLLPEFIDKQYPHGENPETPDRSIARVAIILYIYWLQERELAESTHPEVKPTQND